ncbi:helix-turn-helix domain-containing protein [Rhodanobacter lindaniclasticus]|jgi:transcriptional regulator with XRE-family HTH domain|uniref:Transcriptional regulator n=1 Tax=Rhodanobacter lindaniclasticus TaxID=75310 RepID=A0A4S3KL40_9GAMM|nr:helix-turn-helix transcriptional regulator [Rhodanobacter lindaniclasticus]THD09572.1 transcriptional regulator [Rhodanobacter lindaniclasticus]
MVSTNAGFAQPHPPIGALLREWRTTRRMSQLELALEAGISARHLSYVETGKARASRELIGRLADVFAMPLRERNALLLAGGYAPQYQENALAAPALERMRQAIELIIAHQEPYPAFVIDRQWNVLMANAAAVRVNQLLMDGRESRHANLLHQVFDPDDFRSVIVNWPEVAEKFIRHVHEQLAAVPTDRTLQDLLADVLAYRDVPAHWRLRDLQDMPAPVLTLVFRSRLGELRFFETITTFSMPRDVTLDELRIECAFPADDHTAAVCAGLAASA